MEQAFNTITIAEAAQRGNTEAAQGSNIRKYRVEYMKNNKWIPLLQNSNEKKIKVDRFKEVWGSKVRILIDEFVSPPAIAEIGIYNDVKQ